MPFWFPDPSGHFKLGQWLGKILGAIAGVITTVVTGNPMLGFQVYSAISSVYDTGYALAHGADPLRTIGAFVAANVLSAILPGVPGGLQGDLFAQIAIGAARGAVIGGATAAIAGGDIGQGVLWGAGTGAIIGFAGSQQFQNALNGNGFQNNAEVKQQQIAAGEAGSKGQIAQKVEIERGDADGSAIAIPGGLTQNTTNPLSIKEVDAVFARFSTAKGGGLNIFRNKFFRILYLLLSWANKKMPPQPPGTPIKDQTQQEQRVDPKDYPTFYGPPPY